MVGEFVSVHSESAYSPSCLRATQLPSLFRLLHVNGSLETPSIPLPNGSQLPVSLSLTHVDGSLTYYKIEDPSNRFFGHVVDGGYFIRLYMRDTWGDRWFLVEPAALHIQSGPSFRDCPIHVSYWADDYEQVYEHPSRSIATSSIPREEIAQRIGAVTMGANFLAFRLAISTTFQFSSAVSPGGAPVAAEVQSAISTYVNQLSDLIRPSLAISFVLAPGNDVLYSLSASDSISQENGNAAALSAIHPAWLTARSFTAMNVALALVISTGSDSLIFPESMCNANFTVSALSVIGSAGSVGDPFFFTHFARGFAIAAGATSTFNSDNSGACASGRNPTTAVEPGSGSSIMGHGGQCGSNSVGSASGQFFHIASLVQMHNFLTAAPCFLSSTANPASITAPVIAAPFTVPAGMGFTLYVNETASGQKRFSFHPENVGAAADLSQGDVGTNPLFRPFPPVPTSSWDFPRRIRRPESGEIIPSITRTLHFRHMMSTGAVRAVTTNAIDVLIDAGIAPLTFSANVVEISKSSSFRVAWTVGGTAGLSPTVDIYLVDEAGVKRPAFCNAINDGEEDIFVSPDLANGGLLIRIEGRHPLGTFVATSQAILSGTGAPPSRPEWSGCVNDYPAVTVIPALSPDFNSSDIPKTNTTLGGSTTDGGDDGLSDEEIGLIVGLSVGVPSIIIGCCVLCCIMMIGFAIIFVCVIVVVVGVGTFLGSGIAFGGVGIFGLFRHKKSSGFAGVFDDDSSDDEQQEMMSKIDDATARTGMSRHLSKSVIWNPEETESIEMDTIKNSMLNSSTATFKGESRLNYADIIKSSSNLTTTQRITPDRIDKHAVEEPVIPAARAKYTQRMASGVWSSQTLNKSVVKKEAPSKKSKKKAARPPSSFNGMMSKGTTRQLSRKTMGRSTKPSGLRKEGNRD